MHTEERKAVPALAAKGPATHHKPLRVLLHMLVRGDGDGHGLLVAVIVVGLDVLSAFQPVRLLRRDRQNGQNQLLFSGTDQVHHLFVGRTFHADPVTAHRNERRFQQTQLLYYSAATSGHEDFQKAPIALL